MKYEFHAYFALALQDEDTQKAAISWLAGKSKRLPDRWPIIRTLEDELARLAVLTQAIGTTYREYARSGTRKESDGYRYWVEHHAPRFLAKRQANLSSLGLLPTSPDLSIFPFGSWAIQFSFTLRKPYLSKDDTALYIIDNPVRKEWVFKVPYVASSQWKGALRAAMVQELVSWWHSQSSGDPHEFARRRFRQALLFGDEKGEEPGTLKGLARSLDQIGGPEAAAQYRQWVQEFFGTDLAEPLSHHRGRLYFYPTFFDRIDMEIINPHNRRTGTGARGPILIECVPAGAQGTFSLLYVPFDLLGQDEAEIRRQAAEDLQQVAEAITAIMLTHGFSAKRTSGYGTAKDEIEGKVRTRAGEKPLKRLSQLAQEVKDVAF